MARKATGGPHRSPTVGTYSSKFILVLLRVARPEGFEPSQIPGSWPGALSVMLWARMVGQVGLEPTTSSGNGFTVRGDTNYALLTHICAVSGTSRNPVFYMLSALGLASMLVKNQWWR